jgi:adenine deaminase
VVARGRLIARDGRLLGRVPEPPWRRIFTRRSARWDRRWRARAAEFELGPGAVPVLRLVSAVITALEQRPLAAGDLVSALLDRRGEWITTAGIAGFAPELDGLAATLSTDYQIVALGRRPRAMARAVNRLLELEGGVVLVEGDHVAFELPLPVGGVMAARPLGELAQRERELKALLAARGYAFHDPLFTLYFLVADFLPAVRLSERGVWDVKRARIVRPARRLPGR